VHRRIFRADRHGTRLGRVVGGLASACGAGVRRSAATRSGTPSLTATPTAAGGVTRWRRPRPPPPTGRRSPGLAGRLVRPADADYGTARLLFDRASTARARPDRLLRQPLRTWPSAWRSSGGSAWRSPALRGHSYAVIRADPVCHRRHPDEHVDPGRLGYAAGRRRHPPGRPLRGPRRARRDGPRRLVPHGGRRRPGPRRRIGVVSRAYGTLSDNLESVQMVTPDGTGTECDAESAFRPLLGLPRRGRGNFGVARRSRSPRTRPSRWCCSSDWPWSKAPASSPPGSPGRPPPRRTVVNCRLSSATGDTPTVQVGGTYLGSLSGAQQQISRLVTSRVDPAGHAVRELASARDDDRGRLRPADHGQCHLPGKTPNGRAEPRGGVSPVAHLHRALLPAAVSRSSPRSPTPAAHRRRPGRRGPRRARRRGQSGRSGRDRVRAPRRPVRRAVHHTWSDGARRRRPTANRTGCAPSTRR